MKPYLVLKRVLDFILAFISLILLFPLLLIVAFLIKIEDPKESILYIQERPGKGEKIFKIYKFRTMRSKVDKETSDVERITKVGKILRKTSIDELPQLINILKGDMSFIGPRPLLVDYLKYYTAEQRKRHNVLPGISGLAQINGRNNISWEEKFKYDIWYVENIGFLLDLKIFFLTIIKVFQKKDINKSNNITMEKFKGSRLNE